MKLPKLIVILGPTSTGKSDFAVRIAKKVDGEIVSADSRQVYKGLTIGSGKITKREMKGVPHHLLDITSPKKVFNVSDYSNLAISAIAEIAKRGKVPILAGGTGFYIDSVLYGNIFPEVPPNKKLRVKLEKKSISKLFKLLQKIDSARAKTIEQQNPVRLVRAIEIATALGSVPMLKKKARFNTLSIGLDSPDDILRKKIHDRLLARMKQGLVSEVKKLHSDGVSWKRLENLGLEYRHVAQYLQGKVDKETMLHDLETAIWHYAKRQRTWFKRNKKILWVNTQNKTALKDAENLAVCFTKTCA